MRFDFNMVVWGDSYVATLLDAVLPNQATPGNLGAFQGVGKAEADAGCT